MGVVDFRPLPEKRVGLVEKEDDVGILSRGEQTVERFFGLADVLADDTRQVDLVERQSELVRDHLRGHRLAGPGRAREQCRYSLASGQLSRESPFLEDLFALNDSCTDLFELLKRVAREHQISPREVRFNPIRQCREILTALISSPCEKRLKGGRVRG